MKNLFHLSFLSLCRWLVGVVVVWLALHDNHRHGSVLGWTTTPYPRQSIHRCVTNWKRATTALAIPTATQLFQRPNEEPSWDFDDTIDKPRHSYVEGESFADRESEIEAMGGDPFFLVDDEERLSSDDENESPTDVLSSSSSLFSSMAMMSTSGGVIGDILAGQQQTSERSVTDGMGPTPKTESNYDDDDNWEWDGFVDETAYFDDD